MREEERGRRESSWRAKTAVAVERALEESSPAPVAGGIALGEEARSHGV